MILELKLKVAIIREKNSLDNEKKKELNKTLWERLFGCRCITHTWSFLGTLGMIVSSAVALYILWVDWDVWSGRRGVILDVDW